MIVFFPEAIPSNCACRPGPGSVGSGGAGSSSGRSGSREPVKAVVLSVVTRPGHLAIKVDRCDTAAAEGCMDVLSTRERSRCGVGILVAFFPGYPLEGSRIPQGLSVASFHGDHVTGRAFVSG